MMPEIEAMHLETSREPGTDEPRSTPNVVGWLKKHGLVILLLTLALLRGFSYANLLPPWAIIDEEQHLHYIQVLSEERRRPDLRNDYLSDEIITSLFDTHRWETFGFVTPPAQDPRVMGLEGFSYEGYQPPLYYLLMLPIYHLAQGSMLEKLFIVRWATVALSTLTILLTYSMVNKLGGSKRLAFLAALILLSIPERTVAVSRVNNDALLEIFGALYLWFSLRAIMETPRDRDLILLGLVLGLGTLTKMTMLPLVIALPFVFYHSRETYSIRRGLALSLGSAAVLILPLIAYNLQQFGDVTGFGAVAPMLIFPSPTLSLVNLLKSLVNLFTNSWVILWQSSQASINPTFTTLFALMFLLVCVGIYGLVKALRSRSNSGQDRRQHTAYGLLLLLVGIYAAFTLYSYWLGQVPVIQGRFLLPVSAAIASLMVTGLRRAPSPALSLLGLILALLLMDGLALFTVLLPQYYPPGPSTVLGNNLTPDFFATIEIYLQRIGAYKPGSVQQLLGATITGYILAQALVLLGGVIAIRKLLKPAST